MRAGNAVRKKYMQGDLRCGWMMDLSPSMCFKYMMDVSRHVFVDINP